MSEKDKDSKEVVNEKFDDKKESKVDNEKEISEEKENNHNKEEHIKAKEDHIEAKEHSSHHKAKSSDRKIRAKLKAALGSLKLFQVLTLILALSLIFSIAVISSNSRKFSVVSQKVDSVLDNIESKSTSELKSSLDDVKSILGDKSEITKIKSEDGKIELSKDAVPVRFYVMSQCPYGVQVLDGIAPTLKTLEGYVDFKVNYIANENPDGTFSSLHGENEVLGNIIELCAMKYFPRKYMDMIVCMDENYGSIPSNWESCATKAGIDTTVLKSCYEGSEGKSLLSKSIAESQAVGASGSPTMYIANQPYNGGRKSSDFLRSICSEFKTDKPQACLNIPEPTKVNLLLLNDKACVYCDLTNLVSQLKGMFPGLNVVGSLDFEDSEGRALYDALELKELPIILFDETVKKDEAYSQISSYLVPVGNYTYLRIGADFDPFAEICNNQKDDRDNDGKVDCDDDECKDNIVCRPELTKDLKVFVMSECPYGIRGENAMKEVFENFNNDIDFEIHYIASEPSPGVFQSLHGQREVEENIRQLCIKKYYDDKHFDYILCRNEDIVGDWKVCASNLMIDEAKIETCANGNEGKEMFSADIKIAQALGISASPTWLANNKHMFQGIDAETVKTNYCSVNPGLEGCENVLSLESTASASTPTC